MTEISIEIIEQRIRDHQAELAGLSVDYGDQQVALTKIGERMAISEGELNALTGILRSRLEEQARAEAVQITRDAAAELGETRRKLADVTAELERAEAAVKKAAVEKAAKAKKSSKTKGSP
jgi:hypothetical protein